MTSVHAPGRLALFDLDDTLIDRQRAFTSWLDEFLTKWRLGEDARSALAHADHRGEAPRESLLAVAKEFGVTDDFPRFMTDYLADMPRHVTVFPGVVGGLSRLRRQGWRIGVITNGDALMQRSKIRRAGLEPLIDATVISDEVGLRKPDPRIFALARRLAAARADQGGWMVGDALHTDIAGGAASGLRTIWLPGPWIAYRASGPPARTIRSPITPARRSRTPSKSSAERAADQPDQVGHDDLARRVHPDDGSQTRRLVFPAFRHQHNGDGDSMEDLRIGRPVRAVTDPLGVAP